MKDGQKAILIPGISTIKETGAYNANRNRIADTIKGITEEVTILKAYTGTGNSKVVDSKGIVFYCNSQDLQDWTPEFYD